MNPGQSLAGLRLVVGIGAYIAPDLTGKAFGLDPAANPQASYTARLFGVRDVALAIGTLAAPAGSRSLWWQVGILCDVADVGAAVLGHRSGRLTTLSAIAAGGVAAVAVGAGVQALLAEPEEAASAVS